MSAQKMTFQEFVQKNVVPQLQKDLGLKNKLAVPKIEKININVGIGTYMKNNKDFSAVIDNIAKITGQKPVVSHARKAISNFKLREGMPSGVCTTLRGKRMYDFLGKLINVVLPRVRDFRGLSTRSFDGKGNFSIGIREYTIFPEIKLEDVVQNHGLQINIITTAKDDKSGYELLKQIGVPFKKEPLKT